MNLKAKLEKMEEKKLEEKNSKNTSQVFWMEKAYNKNAKYASAKVYTK